MMMYLHGGDWKRLRDRPAHHRRARRRPGSSGSPPEEVDRGARPGPPSPRPKRYTILGDNGLTREAAERLATITGVVE